MSEQIYPLFSLWSESVPNDFKMLFLSSDSEGSNSRKQSQTIETIIIDEEYEIVQSEVQTQISMCPICYQYINNTTETQIYSCVLNNYYNIHFQCSQVKNPKLFHFGNNAPQRCQLIPYQILKHDLVRLEDTKAFLELQIFHPIGSKPLVDLNTTTELRHKSKEDTALLIHDFLLPKQALYNPKKMFVPLLEVRMRLTVTIMEPKYEKCFEFFTDLNKSQDGEHCIQFENLTIGLTILEKTRQQAFNESGYDVISLDKQKMIQLNYMEVQIEDLLKYQLQSQSQIQPKNFNFEALLHSPKITKHMTPQVGPTPIRQRFQSLQLEDSQMSPPTEWNDEVGSIDQIRGNIVNFVRTQHGSRLIQKYFTTCTQQELDLLLNEIDGHIADLMIDPYANYMFGCLSQSCAPQQRIFILQNISHKLVDIACDKKGTHAVQSLISLVSTQQEEELIENSIKNQIIKLTLDSQGTHLVKKIIARFSEDRLNILFMKIMDKFNMVVNHQFGLCVLKDIISRFKNNSEKSLIILQKMSQNIDDIVQDPFGNYAIQHAIDIFGDQKCQHIIERILQKLLQLSIHKYSSNVVEKCILDTSAKTQKRFFKQLSLDTICLELMKNKFGSFVLQKALQESHKHQDDSLYLALNRNLNFLYAINVKQKWQEFLQRK